MILKILLLDKEIEAAMRLVINDFEEYLTLSNRISPDTIINCYRY